MHLLILGATGNTGLQFVEMALARGHTLTGLVRSPMKLVAHPRLVIMQGSPMDGAVLGEAVRGVDAVVSCLGIRKADPSDPWSELLSPPDFTERCTRLVTEAMKAQGIGRIVVISSAGVGDSWGVVNPELQAVIEKSNIRLVFQDLNRMEQALDDSGLDTLAVRPVALIQGQATGNCELVRSFEKTSRITTGEVAQWMLDAVERAGSFTERSEMIGTPTIS